MFGPGNDERHLRDYLRIIRRRKWTLILSTLLVVLASIAVTFVQSPVYQARATVLLEPGSKSLLLDSTSDPAYDASVSAQTEIQVLRGQEVAALARKRLGSASGITASQVGDTRVIALAAKSPDARRAAAIANAYVDAYAEYRRKKAVDDFLAAAQEGQARITQLQRQLDALDAQTPLARAGAQVSNPQRDALAGQITALRQRADQLQLASGYVSGGVRVVTPASAPTEPISPRPVRNVVSGLGVGLVLGLGLAFLLEYLDDTVKSKDELERVAAMPTLGLIPTVEAWKDPKQAVVISRAQPASAAAEAYRTLRTSVQFIGLDRPLRVVQVTSSSAAEGKTTTLVNLGVALARAGQRVILVCCDLRRPRLSQFFNLPNTIGFTSVLLGDVPLADALQSLPGEQRLMLLASGPPPPNPSELLSSRRTTELLEKLKTNCDIVLVDSPPVLPVTDAAVLSGRVDATLLVATAGVTTRREVGRAVELLRQVEAPLVGTVLNGVSHDDAYGYAYNYVYYRAEGPGTRRQPAVQT